MAIVVDTVQGSAYNSLHSQKLRGNLMSTIQLRDINTGELLSARQISDDAGVYQKEVMAEKMANTIENHLDFIYAVEVVDGIAKYKWKVGGLL